MLRGDNRLNKYILIKVIDKVTSNPNTRYSVRGLSKILNISSSTSKSALDYMKEKGMVTLEVIGKTYQYQIDLSNPLTRQWKVLFNLDKVHGLNLVKNLIKQTDHIYSILLYGSMAKGLNDIKSDIDLLVIVDKNKKFNLNFIKSQDINISIYTMKEWKRNAKQNKVFYENVIYDSIVLYGDRPVVVL